MIYMGSKRRIAKDLLRQIMPHKLPTQAWVEPFCGGMNMTIHVPGRRVVNDAHYYLMAMWKALIEDGWEPPEYVTKEEYTKVKQAPHDYPAAYAGWVGFVCSFRCQWLTGFADKVVSPDGAVKDYQASQREAMRRQLPLLQGVEVHQGNYADTPIPNESVVYCDPPYAGTSDYAQGIDHDEFWEWCRELAYAGHDVFISEYTAPEDFQCIWEGELVNPMGITRDGDKATTVTERLFTFDPLA